MKAVLAFGANLDQPTVQIQRAATSLAATPGIAVHAASALYATEPWGVADQAEFRNSVLIVDVDESQFSPLALLHLCQEQERAAQRVREQRWGPRTLDVDIVSLWVEGHEYNSNGQWGDDLIIPHPWAQERAFVLVPWLDADPTATLGGVPLAQLIADRPPMELAGVRKLADVIWSP